jgi:hypothetical protein
MPSLREQLKVVERELRQHRDATLDGAPWTSDRCEAIYTIANRLLAALKVYEQESRFDGRIGDLARVYVANALKNGTDAAPDGRS